MVYMNFHFKQRAMYSDAQPIVTLNAKTNDFLNVKLNDLCMTKGPVWATQRHTARERSPYDYDSHEISHKNYLLLNQEHKQCAATRHARKDRSWNIIYTVSDITLSHAFGLKSPCILILTCKFFYYKVSLHTHTPPMWHL